MNNTYFSMMYQEGCKYQEKKDEAEKQRRALFDQDKYDEGTAVMKAFTESNPFPFSDGAMKAFQSYRNSEERGSYSFEVDDLPWAKDIKDFVETLKAAGIKRFIVTDQSTGLMEGIYGLVASGCQMGGLRIITREKDYRFGSDEPERKNGIEFTIA